MTNPIDSGSRPPGTSASSDLRNKAAKKPADGEATEQSGVEASRASGAQAPSAASSTVSERLQSVQDRIDSTPDVNAQRVADIKKSIAEGSYPINPQRIAGKFAELQKLLNG